MLHRRTKAEPFFLRGGKLALRRRYLSLRGGKLLLRRLLLAKRLLQPFTQGERLFMQFFYFYGTAEQTGISCQGAAGQRTARINHLTVQRNNAEPVAIAAGNRYGRIQILGDNNPAQNGVKHPLVCRLALAKRSRNPYKTRAAFQPLLLQYISPHGRQWQKGRAPLVLLLQQKNRPLCILLLTNNNILHSSAHRRLNGDRIGARYTDQPGHRPMNP